MVDLQKLRLDGVYAMNDAGELMLRIKVPAGILSVEQAGLVGDLSARFAADRLHLTTRGSIELHRLRHQDLGEIFRQLAKVGLTSRGACGGAVRGVSCSTTASPGFSHIQLLIRRLHRHFTGNPHFEGLPKKFKIAVEAEPRQGRHLIQDVGLVFRGDGTYDLWIAGGLGREPRTGFLYQNGVREEEILPLVEAIVRAYQRHAPPPKRLKYLAATLGERELRRLIEVERQGHPVSFPSPPLEPCLTGSPHAGLIEIPFFAGELSGSELHQVAALAREHRNDFLVVTANQDLALFAEDAENRAALVAALAAAGFPKKEGTRVLRVCPGNHACRMGLAATRDLARRIAEVASQDSSSSLAVSGCPNSCSQPQLADFGIFASRLAPSPEGGRAPLFTLLKRNGEGLGLPVAEGLSLEGLLERISTLLGTPP